MLYDFNLDNGWQVCPVNTSCRHLDLAQRRIGSWVVQGDLVPVRGNKPLCNLYPGFVRVWRVQKSGVKFVGYCLLRIDAWSRFLKAHNGNARKQLLVTDQHFNEYVNYNGKDRLLCNVLFGTVQVITCLEDRVGPSVAGTVYEPIRVASIELAF